MNSILSQTKDTIRTINNTPYPGPSMLSSEEKAFYYLLGSTLLTLEGAVVDAGCWLGSSSFYLGKGIEQNKKFNGSQVIYAYDIFRWDKNHDQQIKKHLVSIKENDDFHFLTDKFLETLKLRVVTRQIDYSISPSKIQYHSGEPIEALIVDAGKTPKLLFNILEGYLPYCIEDKAVIFFQDYRDYFCWFIPPVVSFLNDILEPMIYLDNGGAGFRFRNKQEAKKLLDDAREMFKDGTALEKYYDKAIAKVGEKYQETFYQIKANKVAVFLHLQRVTEAYYGHEQGVEKIDAKFEPALLAYVKDLDSSWPVRVIDTPLQNAYRRVRHAVTGKKDLTLNFKPYYYYKRRILNPIYLKIFLKRLFR